MYISPHPETNEPYERVLLCGLCKQPLGSRAVAMSEILEPQYEGSSKPSGTCRSLVESQSPVRQLEDAVIQVGAFRLNVPSRLKEMTECDDSTLVGLRKRIEAYDDLYEILMRYLGEAMAARNKCPKDPAGCDLEACKNQLKLKADAIQAYCLKLLKEQDQLELIVRSIQASRRPKATWYIESATI